MGRQGKGAPAAGHQRKKNFLARQNEQDLEELPDHVKKSMKFIPVDHGSSHETCFGGITIMVMTQWDIVGGEFVASAIKATQYPQDTVDEVAFIGRS